jgi:thiol-disulfide isomerase/thioredoxin
MLQRVLGNRLALRGALAALALALLAYGLLRHSPARRVAPALPAHVVAGAPVTLSELRGHAAAVVFFASWCDGCRKEGPAVARFAASAAGRGRVIAVDTSDGGNWRGFLREYAWRFPVFRDGNGLLSDGYEVHALPTTVIIDPKGRIASLSAGAQTVAGLSRELAAAS